MCVRVCVLCVCCGFDQTQRRRHKSRAQHWHTVAAVLRLVTPSCSSRGRCWARNFSWVGSLTRCDTPSFHTLKYLTDKGSTKYIAVQERVVLISMVTHFRHAFMGTKRCEGEKLLLQPVTMTQLWRRSAAAAGYGHHEYTIHECLRAWRLAGWGWMIRWWPWRFCDVSKLIACCCCC